MGARGWKSGLAMRCIALDAGNADVC